MTSTDVTAARAATSTSTSSIANSHLTHRSRSLSALRARIGARLSRSREPQPSEMQLPERFHSDDADEEDDDGGAENSRLDGGMAVQSFYSVIAQAQGKGRFTKALQQTVDEEEEEEEEEEAEEEEEKEMTHSGLESRSSRRTIGSLRGGCSTSGRNTYPPTPTNVNPRSLSNSTQEEVDMMAQSQILPPPTADIRPRVPPVDTQTSTARLSAMNRRLQAKAKMDFESSVPISTGTAEASSTKSAASLKKASIDINVALADIFALDKPEQLVSEFPCWYLQNVLVQGYMYITERHICFFAYIQKKSNLPMKTGHLSKQGKHSHRYSRFWFVLKGDVLSYFASAADPYFPSGAIDLRRGISAELIPEKGKEKHDLALFDIITDYRTYHFRADSPASAREWVKQLQKVIFRSHNDGDSVKISVPLANILDVESSPVIDFAETIRIRVIDDEDTFSVEEYCFTFFQNGHEALRLLNSLITLRPEPASADELGQRGRRSTSTLIEPVRTTVTSRSRTRSPMRIRRPGSQRSHASRPRSSSRIEQARDHGPKRITDSPNSSAGIYSESQSASSFGDNDEDISAHPLSASQFLSGDKAFRSPTMRKPRESALKTIDTEHGAVSQLSLSPEKMESVPPSRTISTETTASLHESQTEDTSVKHTPIAKPGNVLTGPLQQAFGLADRVRSQSKRMSSYIGSSPKDYYTKISGAIRGGTRHYSEAEGLATEDRYDDAEELLDTMEHERRFHEHFALPESERLLAVYYCWLYRVLPLYGKIYVGTSRLCFRSLLYGTRTKLNLPYQDVDNLQKEKGIRWGYPGMVVVIRGHEELFFDFAEQGIRDDCVVTILRQKEDAPAIEDSMIMTEEEKIDAQVAAAEHELLLGARRKDHLNDVQIPLQLGQSNADIPPILFDDSAASVLDIRPQQSMRITCLTIGSRGDVQPYVALCKGLLAEGHHPRIATHAEFEPFVTKHGIDFVAVEGDPAELMRICVEYGMFTPSFLYEVNSKFRGWLDRLLDSAYEACQGSDLLIESPSAMGGIHIAEALQIPYFRAFTMPWTRTRAYPHAFAVPNKKMGGQYNYMTYFLFDNMFWKVTAGQINRWRSKKLKLGPTSLEKLQPNKVPFLYNFSPTVVPPPLDFSDWVRVTGYWFLDEGNEWRPPHDLQAFIDKARADKMKLVYIGFGSVVVSDSRQLTEQVVGAVQKADVRCILSKGWSDRLATRNTDDDGNLPDCVFRINAAPHDWLFRQVDAVVHHGGAGTTGASLRAGVPTIIKPFFGDQFFFANRVEDLGVGIFLKKITINALGKALWIATHDDRMITKASVLGEQVDREDGVGNAIKAIYRDLEYARSLIKKRDVNIAPTRDKVPSAPGPASRTSETDPGEEFPASHLESDDEEEESWTFVESESDVDVTAARSRANSYASMLLPALSATKSASGTMGFAGGLNPFAGVTKR